MKVWKNLAKAISLTLLTSGVQADVFFKDSFESANLSATNADGFRWAPPNRTSIVRDDQYVVWNGRPIENGPIQGREWEAVDGRHSLRFRYPTGVYMSEQRFAIGKAYKDLWVGFSARVPINFEHSNKAPSNNKLFAIWMDDYSARGKGPSVIWEFWSDGSGGSQLATHYSPGGEGAGPHMQHFPFINYPNDQGRWMDVVFHIKAASGPGAKNGVIEFYRRWQGETTFKRHHYLNNADIAPADTGPDGWAAGYLMGWSNPAYAQDTEWLIDNFTLSDTSLLSPSPGGCKPEYTLSTKPGKGSDVGDAFDGDLNTWVYFRGLEEYIDFKFCERRELSSVNIAFQKGHKRQYVFKVQTSDDGINYVDRYQGVNSGTRNNQFETFTFRPVKARYARVVGLGNNENDWNAYWEIEFP